MVPRTSGSGSGQLSVEQPDACLREEGDHLALTQARKIVDMSSHGLPQFSPTLDRDADALR